MKNVTEIFCRVDDFWQEFEPHWQVYRLANGAQRLRRTRLSMSELMTIVILFHQSNYRTFKAFYTEYVLVYMRREFPNAVSYTRFVELMPRTIVPLLFFVHTCMGRCTGIAFVDATPLAVCHNRPIPSHRVFDGRAERGKTSMGWFYGFKLHLIINDRGELLSFRLTPGNVDDRKPVPGMADGLFGKLFGDKGYIKQALVRDLLEKHDLHLVTPIRKNMKNALVPLLDKLLLRKRSIIETVNDQLKNMSQIEHSRHRSPWNFLVNLLGGLIAYCFQPKKPSLHLTSDSKALLPIVL